MWQSTVTPTTRHFPCPVWFALNTDRPLAAVAGIWRPWTGLRCTKAEPVEGEGLPYSFLNSQINPQSHLPRMLNMKLLQKAQTYFRKPDLPLVIQRQAAAHDEQVGSSRSKRAQIRDVLRQYERGSLKEAEAVEELLKILR